MDTKLLSGRGIQPPSKVQANRPNWRAPTNAHASATFPLWRVVKRVTIVEKGRCPPITIQTILVLQRTGGDVLCPGQCVAVVSGGNGLVSVTAQIIVTAREKTQ